MSMPMPMSPPMPMPNNDSMPSMMMNMQMSFFWGKDVVLLFSGWPGYGHLGMYILALVVVFLLAAGAEILSVAPGLKPKQLGPAAVASLHSLVFAARMALLYLIMLSVMSYNGGVFVVAVVGHAVGYFVVRYRALVAVARATDSDPKI